LIVSLGVSSPATNGAVTTIDMKTGRRLGTVQPGAIPPPLVKGGVT
jgi:hypothetical protein